MFRCMTCDAKKKGEPIFLPLDANNEAGETIGVCERCAITIRSYNTMAALAAGEYDSVLHDEPKGRCLCDGCAPTRGSA